MVGHATLIGGLPLLAQIAQHLLHLAAAIGLALGLLQECLGLAHQFLAQLVCAPALPALELACCTQRAMGLVFQRSVNQLAMFLELVAQFGSRLRRGLAVALGHLLLQF